MKDPIIREILQSDKIIIHRHVRPDPDALGSQGGLADIIKASFPDKQVFIVGQEETTLTFLTEMDQVSDGQYKDALVIVCDTANQGRISDSRYKTGKKLIKIDHHPNEDPYGDILWVDTGFSSTSEMIYELYLEGKKQGMKLSDQAARLIYAGIIGDTGRFLYPSTNTRTFAYAADLVKKDFDRGELYDHLYNTKLNVVRLHGYILQHLLISDDGSAYIKLPKEILQQFGVSPSEASQLVSAIGNVEGLKAWVFFVEEDDQIRIRLRSKGPVINTIAQKYNGGGHPMASGASIYSWDRADTVIEDIQKACMEWEK